jgi:conjugative relaxase-like TrwC/TraI family protein
VGAHATPIHTAEQGDYRLLGVCGEEEVRDVAVEYRLGLARGQDPIIRLGTGWKRFGRAPGTALATVEDVEEVRRIIAGRHPRTSERLMKFKQATAPAALLPARPLVAAVDKAAAGHGVSVEELLWRLSWEEDAARPRPSGRRSPWSWKRYERLVRCLTSEGEHHKAPVADLERVALAAGVDLTDVYEDQALAHARDHRGDRVDIGVRAWDLTLTRPRRQQLAQEAAPPAIAARMEAIHDEAVAETVAYAETVLAYVMRGHHGDGQSAQRRPVEGIIATATKHRTSRAVVPGEPGDPHTHTHVMISAMGCDPADGAWLTIGAGGRDLMRHVAMFGEMQRAIERRKLTQEFGFVYAQDPESRQWDVVGIPDVVKAGFSRRRDQARAEAGEGASGKASRAAARKTAAMKVASTRAQERASWHKRMKALGFPARVLWKAVLRGREPGAEGPAAARGPRPDLGPDPDAVAAAVWDPEAGVTATRKVVTEARIMAAVAAVCEGGIASGEELEALTAHVLAHPMALRLPDQGATHMSHAARFTAADLPAAEALILDTAEAGMGAGKGVVDLEEAAAALKVWQGVKGFALSREQLGTVSRLIRAGHHIDTVLGVAGSGKTSIMSATRCAWEAAGLRVEGAAVAAVAAANLRAEAGIPSRTIASWRQSITDGRGLEGVDVLVVDEGATVGDRDMAALVAEAVRCGTKIVSIGDPLQLRPVAAGSVFARLHHRLDGPVLTENRRQKSAVDRQVLETWRTGARTSALTMWAQRGMVHAPVDADAAHAQMAAAWTADRTRYTNPLVAVDRLLLLAVTRADVDALNRKAAAAARAAGHVGKELVFTTRGGEDLALGVGEQVRVRRNDYRSRHGDEPDVLNGFRGVVTAVDARRGACVAWHRDGQVQQAWITPAQLRRGDLDLGYATTIASAQGMTTDRCHVYGLGADARALYPAMSRARERTDLYLPGAEIEPETTRARLGDPADEAQALARAVAAYAATLTDDDDQLLLDELADRLPAGTPELPAPAAAAAAAVEDQAMVVPEHERQAAQANALIRRANELETEQLPALREEYRLAAQRAEIGRLRLLMEGTTPAAARAGAQDARNRLDTVLDQVRDLRIQAADLHQQAQRGHERHAREQVEADQKRRLLTKLEPVAVEHGLTRAELSVLDPAGITQLERRARRLMLASLSGRDEPGRPSRITVPTAPALAPAAAVHASRPPRPTLAPPTSAPAYKPPPVPRRGRGGPGYGR